MEIAQKPCTSKLVMYKPRFRQLSFVDEFYLPFGGKLQADNRWVKLANAIPWFAAEEIYAKNFTAANGTPVLSVRTALGSLIIKETLSITDEETVAQIQKNPYLQFFVGFTSFQNEAPFDASLMTHFRKRFTSLDVANVQEHLRNQYRELLERRQQQEQQQKESRRNGAPKRIAAGATKGRAVIPENPNEAEPEPAINEALSDKSTPDAPPLDDDIATCSLSVEGPENKGQLILDATCAPADIRYPTDLGLLNDARVKTEQIIDKLYAHAPEGMKKPRTYRKNARKDFLNVTKLRMKPAKTLRKGLRKQLGYLGRNLKSIEALAAEVSLSVLSKQLYGKLLVCSEIYRQQRVMYKTNSHQMNDRIISVSQPHVRPIVRGKASAKTEFGMKLSLSVVDGWSNVEKMSWSAYNEGSDLIAEITRYYEREGYYPESVHVDKIYRNRANRQWCKVHGIRMSGVPLGRPPKDPEVNAERKRLTRKDEGIRNAVEGKFGQGKRRFGMNRIMAKLAGTSETVVALIVMVMNLQKLLGVHFLRLFGCVWSFMMAKKALYSLLRPKTQQLVALVEAISLEARFVRFSKCC